MKKEVAVVIPYYHNQLTEFETLSYRNCLDTLYNYPIILVIPEGMSIEEHPLKSNIIYEVVPKQWMESVDSYNQTMLSKEFYNRFVQYRYILIFQLDAFVFSDSLMQFCNYDYDYIGAPWLFGMKYLKTLKKGVWYVGNGGFSLRKVSAFLDVLNKENTSCVNVHEDIFWASCDSKDFRVAPVEIALTFAFERDVRKCYLLNNNKLPFGCHAWEKYDFQFWRPIFEERGYYIQTQLSKGMDYYDKTADIERYYLDAKGETVQFCLTQFTTQKEFPIYVFGAGRMGCECCWLLQRSKIHNIICIDNNRNAWGEVLWGVEIRSPEILAKKKDNLIVIIAVGDRKNEIVNQLEHWGYQYGQEVILYSDFINCIKEKMANL